VGGPEAGVQAGQRVEDVEQLLGKGKVRISADWHVYLPGKANRPGGTSAAFLRLVTLGFGARGGEAAQAEEMGTLS